MKLTNGEIWKVKEPMRQLMKAKFPVKTCYALIKMSSELDKQIAIIDKVRRVLVNKYGIQDERTHLPTVPEFIIEEGVTIPNPNYARFKEEWGELLAETVDLDVKPVRIPDETQIEPSTLFLLSHLVSN